MSGTTDYKALPDASDLYQFTFERSNGSSWAAESFTQSSTSASTHNVIGNLRPSDFIKVSIRASADTDASPKTMKPSTFSFYVGLSTTSTSPDERSITGYQLENVSPASENPAGTYRALTAAESSNGYASKTGSWVDYWKDGSGGSAADIHGAVAFLNSSGAIISSLTSSSEVRTIVAYIPVWLQKNLVGETAQGISAFTSGSYLHIVPAGVSVYVHVNSHTSVDGYIPTLPGLSDQPTGDVLTITDNTISPTYRLDSQDPVNNQHTIHIEIDEVTHSIAQALIDGTNTLIYYRITNAADDSDITLGTSQPSGYTAITWSASTSTHGHIDVGTATNGLCKITATVDLSQIASNATSNQFVNFYIGDYRSLNLNVTEPSYA